MKKDKLAEKELLMYNNSLPCDAKTDIKVNNLIFQKRVTIVISFIFIAIVTMSLLASFLIN